jgi:hypothetical protein
MPSKNKGQYKEGQGILREIPKLTHRMIAAIVAVVLLVAVSIFGAGRVLMAQYRLNMETEFGFAVKGIQQTAVGFSHRRALNNSWYTG